MFQKKLHLHSMIVHAIIALGPLAALALIFKQNSVTLGFMSETAWNIIEKASILMMFLIAIPSLITGLGDRDKIYGKWQSTHIVKLWATLFLIGATAVEILAWGCTAQTCTFNMVYGDLVVVANNLFIFVLSVYGLKITLGRQSIEGTSYVPDLFNKEARRDILDDVRAYMKDEAKFVDFE